MSDKEEKIKPQKLKADVPAKKKVADTVAKAEAEKGTGKRKADNATANVAVKKTVAAKTGSKKSANKMVDAEAEAKAKAQREAEGRARTAAKKEAEAKAKEQAEAKAKKEIAETAKSQKASGAAGERNRLKKAYKSQVIPTLMKERGYKNVNQVPRLEKIVLNMRMGDIKDNSKSIQLATGELQAICGQKPVPARAKKSVANFKLREKMVIGSMATLRGERMYEFFDKLVSIALPRVRDFRGLSPKSFDGRGNYALGIKDQLIFPEISYELVEKVRGFDICIVTTAQTDDEAKAFLEKMGMPFKHN